VKICWSEETVAAADNMHDVHAAHGVLAKSILKDRSITAAFERAGKEKVTFLHQQHTRTELQ
jgi:hypothetical protein